MFVEIVHIKTSKTLLYRMCWNVIDTEFVEQVSYFYEEDLFTVDNYCISKNLLISINNLYLKKKIDPLPELIRYAMWHGNQDKSQIFKDMIKILPQYSEDLGKYSLLI